MAQVCLAEDEAAVEKLAAQGADQALASRVIRGAWTAVRTILALAAWKTAAGRGREVRSAVADQESVATRGRTL